MEKVLVVGASINPERFSYKAIIALRNSGYEVVALGLRKGIVADVEITDRRTGIENLHTATLYVGPKNQTPYINYIISLKPGRVIFNPGTENPEFQEILAANGIGFIEDCTLIMLASNRF